MCDLCDEFPFDPSGPWPPPGSVVGVTGPAGVVVVKERVPQCGDADYTHCPECKVDRYMRHLETCSLRPR